MSVAPVSGLLSLAEVRARAAAALAPIDDLDPYVFDNVVDALEPPALVLTWDDPWLTYRAACLFDAQFAVLCIAGRIEPDPGVATLEQLQAHVIGRLRDDDYSWPFTTSTAPRRYVMNGIEYLGARVIYRIPVRI